MQRVIFFGTRFWSQRLADLIHCHAGDQLAAQAIGLNLSSLVPGLHRLLRTDILVRVGFRPGIARPKAVFYDLLWLTVVFFNRRARLYYYWIGTDVHHLLLQRDQRMPLWRAWLLNHAKKRAVHLAAAPWLADELCSLGFDA